MYIYHYFSDKITKEQVYISREEKGELISLNNNRDAENVSGEIQFKIADKR